MGDISNRQIEFIEEVPICPYDNFRKNGNQGLCPKISGKDTVSEYCLLSCPDLSWVEKSVTISN